MVMMVWYSDDGKKNPAVPAVTKTECKIDRKRVVHL
jgi:hypothetical protein